MSRQKIWFVTGASKGMGRSLVNLLLSTGHTVVATSRNIAPFGELANQYKDTFLPLAVDITADEDVKAAVDQSIETFGRLDVVVNNAGYSLIGSLEEVSDEEFRETVAVNLFGMANVIRAVMPYFRAQQAGHFINISSSAGYAGFANAGSYNASKFAIIGLSEALSLETRSMGIHVTVVAPGQFRTSFLEKGSLAFAKNKIPVYQLAEAEAMYTQFSGHQKGDPEKLAKILATLPDHPAPPLHLLLGPDTEQLVTQHRANEKAEFDAWKTVTLSTDFDD